MQLLYTDYIPVYYDRLTGQVFEYQTIEKPIPGNISKRINKAGYDFIETSNGLIYFKSSLGSEKNTLSGWKLFHRFFSSMFGQKNIFYSFEKECVDQNNKQLSFFNNNTEEKINLCRYIFDDQMEEIFFRYGVIEFYKAIKRLFSKTDPL